MYLNDNETATDLLYSEVTSNTIVELIKGAGNEPMSIGLHGDWGAGKSSLLLMTATALDQEEGMACVRCNGWQLQGFQDAKTVIIEQVLSALEQRVKGIPKAKKTLKALFRRVDVLKLAKLAAQGYITAQTGIPLFSVNSAIGGLVNKIHDNPEGAVEAAEKLRDSIAHKPSRVLPKEMDAFKGELAQLLKEARIKRLVVLVDDLDRCLPETAIETLEAIKLFLFVPNSVFIIAADESMIEYAVKRHFPDLRLSFTADRYAKNYLEKLIQVPFRIPPMGLPETRAYVALLNLEVKQGAQSPEFLAVRSIARERLRKPWGMDVLDEAQLKAQFNGTLPLSVEEALLLSHQLAPLLMEHTLGNPRQVKRFLNTLSLRQAIAKARGLQDEVKTMVLAKVMLAERFLTPLYEQLALESAIAPDGKANFLANLEGSNESLDIAQSNTSERTAQQAWAKLSPPLAGEDLRPYMLITRDQRRPLGAVPAKHAALFRALLGSGLEVSTLAGAVQGLQGFDAQALFDQIVKDIRAKEQYEDAPPGIHGLTLLVKHHSALQTSLLDFAASLPTDRLGGWPLGDARWASVIVDGEAVLRWKEQQQIWAKSGAGEIAQVAKRLIV